MCSLDYEKPFDTVRHDLMMEMLATLGADQADLRILINLYWEQKAVVRIEDDSSNSIHIRRGVRQDCILSPDLFSMYSQTIITELVELELISI